MKIANRILLAGNVLLFAVLGWLLIAQGLPLHPSPGWEYKDLVSVLLTVVTIVLAFLGLAVALAAIWGWQTISQGAARRAAEVATDKTDAHLQSDDFQAKLKVLVEEQVENIKRAAAQQRITAEGVPNDPQPVPQAPRGQPGAMPDETWQD